jgi:hypothetical protein
MNELGIPVRVIKDSDVRNEFINRTFTLKDFVDNMIKYDYIPKE